MSESHVIPNLSRSDSPDGLSGYTELAAQTGMQAPHVGRCSNLADSLFGQRSVVVFGSNVHWRRFFRSVLDRIAHVIRVRIPAQIGYRVVRWVSVVVTAFKSLRAWANESGKHKAMNALRVDSSVDLEIYRQASDPTTLLANRWFKRLAGRVNQNSRLASWAHPALRAYATIRAYFVIRKPWNRAPLNVRHR